MAIKFKDIRRLISVIDRISICMFETLEYDNYIFMLDVPEKYDEYYVYGIGRILSEFKSEENKNIQEIGDTKINEEYFLGQCIEIMLSEKPFKD